jgi:hypothetical protein
MASADGVKPLTFNGFMSWAMFHSQFDAVVEDNWTANKKATHLLTSPHIPTEVLYKDATKMFFTITEANWS